MSPITLPFISNTGPPESPGSIKQVGRIKPFVASGSAIKPNLTVGVLASTVPG